VHIFSKPELLQYIGAHRELFDAQDNPFSGADWLLHWVREVGDAQWRYVVPESAGDQSGVMLLYQKGGELKALTNYYASLYTPLVSSGADRSGAARELVRQLRTLRPSVVDLAPLASEDMEVMAGAFGGWYAKRYFCFGNYHMQCEGLKFADYMAARPSQLHNTWTRKSKKFPGRIEIITGADGLERGIQAYQTIYGKSWKVPEPYPAFVPGWLRICGERGLLRLGLAWLEDVPIAAQFWFVWRRRAFIFKLAYDEAHSKYSAGTILSARLFQLVLEEDRVIEIDYLTGDDDYKRSWMSERRERTGLLACNLGSPRGALRALYERAGALRKRVAA
jgi:hypothetical protein